MKKEITRERQFPLFFYNRKDPLKLDYLGVWYFGCDNCKKDFFDKFLKKKTIAKKCYQLWAYWSFFNKFPEAIIYDTKMCGSYKLARTIFHNNLNDYNYRLAIVKACKTIANFYKEKLTTEQVLQANDLSIDDIDIARITPFRNAEFVETHITFN